MCIYESASARCNMRVALFMCALAMSIWLFTLNAILPAEVNDVNISNLVLNKQCPNDWKQYFQNQPGFVRKHQSDTDYDYIIVSGRLSCVLSHNVFSILQYQKLRTV